MSNIVLRASSTRQQICPKECQSVVALPCITYTSTTHLGVLPRANRQLRTWMRDWFLSNLSSTLSVWRTARWVVPWPHFLISGVHIAKTHGPCTTGRLLAISQRLSLLGLILRSLPSPNPRYRNIHFVNKQLTLLKKYLTTILETLRIL